MSRLLIRIILKFLLVSGIISVSSGLSSVCPSFSVLFLVGLKYVMILGCQVTLTSEGLVWVTPVPAVGVGASGLWGGGWTCCGAGLPGESLGVPWVCLSSGGEDGAWRALVYFIPGLSCLSFLTLFPCVCPRDLGSALLGPNTPNRRLC